jgi:hypothetical protein
MDTGSTSVRRNAAEFSNCAQFLPGLYPGAFATAGLITWNFN